MWKEKFYEDYFADLNEKRNKSSDFILKEEIPKSLFKYIKVDYALKVLEDDFLKASDALTSNDPFEGELLYDSELLLESFSDDLLIKVLENEEFNLSEKEKSLILQDTNPLHRLIYILYHNYLENNDEFSFQEFKTDFLNKYNEFQNYAVKNFNDELKKQLIFVCLSELNNIIPMWAHYANNHEGLCIEYNIFNLDDGFLEECCFPMLYVEKSDFTDDLNYFHDSNRNKLKILEEPFLKKSIDWKYEKEWRILFNKIKLKMSSEVIDCSHLIKKSDGLYFIKFPKPTSVYLGLNISEENKNKIKNICLKRNIAIFKMIKDNSSYNLSFKPIQ